MKIQDLSNLVPITAMDTYCQNGDEVIGKSGNSSIVNNSNRDTATHCGQYYKYKGTEHTCKGTFCDSLGRKICYKLDCVDPYDECKSFCDRLLAPPKYEEISLLNATIRQVDIQGGGDSGRECVCETLESGYAVCSYCSKTELKSAREKIQSGEDCKNLKINWVSPSADGNGCNYKVCSESSFCKITREGCVSEN